MMRKFVCIILLCCVSSLIAVNSARAYRTSKRGKYPADGVVINIAANDRLNIREEPNAKSRILEALNNGAYVTVNGEAHSSNGSLWYYIYDEDSGVSGYVSAKYISVKSQPKSKGKYPADGVVINIAANDRLNIREEPNAKSRILEALDNGAYVTVNGEAHSSNGSLWYYIYDKESGTSGYVSAKYIELR